MKNFAPDLKNIFYSNGKLLLTGEYLVLDGATALAIPTCYKQSLEVVPSENEGIWWKSLDVDGELWYQGEFQIVNEMIVQVQQDQSSNVLSNILQQAINMNPEFLKAQNGYNVTTRLNFPRNWGLGTSSTLIHTISQWLKVDPFLLLQKSFGGSGYDVAVAQNSTPILYELKNGRPHSKRVKLQWNFTDQLFFVHLNIKQDSKEGIEHYRNTTVTENKLKLISDISHSLLLSPNLIEFEKQLQQHEDIISGILQLPTVKERLFSDYPRTIKSLGAWGGDFVLATGNKTHQDYFRKNSYHTIIPFSEMIL